MSLLDNEDILINDNSFLDHIEPNKEYFVEWMMAWKEIFKEATEQYESSIVDHMYLARLIKILKDNYWWVYIEYAGPLYSPATSTRLDVKDMDEFAKKTRHEMLMRYQANCLVGTDMDRFSSNNLENIMPGLIIGYSTIMHYIRFVPNLVNLNEEKVEVYKNWIKYMINKKGTD